MELDFRENRLIRNSESVVTVLVKTPRRHAAKVANARQCGFDEALEKFIHALSPQRYLRANRLIFSQFEIGNAFLGKRLERALPGNQRELRFCFFQPLL